MAKRKVTRKKTVKKVAPKQKVAKTRVTAKKKAAKKKPAKKQAAKAAAATNISYDQLLLAKQMAQQLGGVEMAKETLAALSALATD